MASIRRNSSARVHLNNTAMWDWKFPQSDGESEVRINLSGDRTRIMILEVTLLIIAEANRGEKNPPLPIITRNLF